MRQLVFLGTSAGMPFASNSTAILVEDNTTQLLLDTSGGYTIFRAFHDVGKDPRDITHIFISHYDADHILGIVPLVRLFAGDQKERTIFCSRETKAAIDAIFSFTANRHYEKVKDRLHFELLDDGDTVTISDTGLTAFDVRSGKTPQIGCLLTFSDQTKIAFLGDEPLEAHYLDAVKDCDILLHEAFCTSDQIDRFKPYEKQHGTAREAGANAITANAKTLALFHMEDETLTTRKEKYSADAKASGFAGAIVVPVDGETLSF